MKTRTAYESRRGADTGGSPGRAEDAPGVWWRREWKWATIAIAIPLVLCARKLHLDLWGDEVYTLYHFASLPFARIVTDYSAPNNHIFYTLLLRPLVLVSTEPAWLRFSSLVVAGGVLLATFRLGLATGGRRIAVWAVLALGLNVMFLVHVMQLRGYGLSMLLITCLTNIAVVAVRSWSGYLAIALLTAAALYTIPTNVLFVMPLSIWAGWQAWRRGIRGRELAQNLAPWVAGWLIGACLYLPVARQVVEHQGKGRSGIGQIVELEANVLWAAGHDIWPVWVGAAVALIAWLGRRGAMVNDSGPAIASLVVTMVAGPMVTALAIGMAPFERSFCPMLPFLALATGWLMDCVFARFWSHHPEEKNDGQVLVGGALLAAVLLPAVLLYPARLRSYREKHFAQNGYYNYYAADFEPSCIARELRARVDPAGTYLICYADSDHYNLADALARAGFPIPPRHVAGGRGQAGPMYLVLPPLPRYDELEQRCGLTRAELARFRVLRRCGYYELRQSPDKRMLGLGHQGLGEAD